MKFLLMHSPNWLFMYPGLILFFLGLAFTVILCFGSIKIGPVGLGVHTMMYAAAALMVGANLVMFSLFVRSYASVTGFIPTEGKLDRWLDGTSTERGVVIGLIMCLLGVGATIVAFCLWGKAGFGGLSPESMMRITIPAMLFIVVGIEMVFGSFFIGILHIKHK